MSVAGLVATSLVLLSCMQVALADAPAISLADDRGTCSTSQINYIRCTIQQAADTQELPHVTGLALRWEDSREQSLCIDSKAKRGGKAKRSDRLAGTLTDGTSKTISLTAGDGIYGIRACYDSANQHVVGLMFSAVSGQYVCGNVWKYPKQCVNSRALVAAPLSYIRPACDGNILTGVGKVCWNKYYTPGQVSRECPAGQGIRNGTSSCQLCPVNTYNPGGLSICVKCPSTTIASKVGSSACGCPAGHGYQQQGPNRRCVPCLQGTYSPGGALTPCIRCPYPYMMSPRGAVSIADCLCQPGYGFNSATDSCIPCDRSSYNDGTPNRNYTSAGTATFQPCAACPTGTITPRPQAITADRCTSGT